MTREQFLEGFVEKIVLTALISSFGILLLHSFNAHTKAFEAAQVQARTVSTVAIRSKEDLIGAAFEICNIANGLFFKTVDVSKANPGEDIIRQFFKAQFAVAGLENHQRPAGDSNKEIFEKSVLTAKRLNSELANFRTEYDFAKKSTKIVDVEKLEAINASVAKLEATFLLQFEAELAALLANEFESFYIKFYEGLPWHARPSFLIALALGSAALATGAYFALGNTNVSDAKLSEMPEGAFVFSGRVPSANSTADAEKGHADAPNSH